MNWKAIARFSVTRFVIKTALPFLSGMIGGLLAGCSVTGTGVGVTV